MASLLPFHGGKKNRNKLAIADRIKPFRRGLGKKKRICVAQSLIRMVVCERHFSGDLYSITKPHILFKNSQEWCIDKLAFPLALPEGKLIYIHCYSSQKSLSVHCV